MTLPNSLAAARAISDACIDSRLAVTSERLPIPEVTELQGEKAEADWSLALRLQAAAFQREHGNAL